MLAMSLQLSQEHDGCEDIECCRLEFELGIEIAPDDAVDTAESSSSF